MLAPPTAVKENSFSSSRGKRDMLSLRNSSYIRIYPELGENFKVEMKNPMPQDANRLGETSEQVEQANEQCA